jgi:UDP-glucose 4-epimerase
MLAGLPTTIYGDGSQTRDFVYVTDVAAAFLAACELPVEGLRLNIGTGLETSVRQLHTELAGLCGAPDEPRLEPARVGELHRSALDASRARQLLSWEPRTGLRTGLAETVEWLRGSLAAPTQVGERQ